jgi:hypothetical protein
MGQNLGHHTGHAGHAGLRFGIRRCVSSLTEQSVFQTAPQFLNIAEKTNSFTLAWTALANRNYTLQYTGDLSSPSWTTLTNLTGALPVLTVTDTAAPANTNRFYRLILNP